MRTRLSLVMSLLLCSCLPVREEPVSCAGDSCTDASGSGGSTGSSGSSGEDGGSGSGGAGVGGAGAGGGGGTAGTVVGGGGSDAMVGCTDSSDCEAEAPRCTPEGVCGACTNNTQCSGGAATLRCDTRDDSDTEGQCVQCTADAHCGDELFCVESRCVPCRNDGDCASLETPECNEANECVACTGDAACDGRPGTERCDLNEDSEHFGRCVACVEHGDCDNPEPQCGEDRACESCTGDGACTGRTGTPYCNLLEDASTEGECVACTGATEATACSTRACKRDTGTCTTRNRGSVLSCGACEADSECGADRRCVENRVGGVLEGTFCFVREGTAGCAEMDDNRRPYSEPRDLVSVDGTDPDTYCFPITTCAMIDADSDTSIGKPCEQNTDCGHPSFPTDGICNASDVCTYSCSQHYQCPGTGLTDCSVIGGPGGYCE